jgi:hypothetical protein
VALAVSYSDHARPPAGSIPATPKHSEGLYAVATPCPLLSSPFPPKTLNKLANLLFFFALVDCFVFWLCESGQPLDSLDDSALSLWI